MRILIKWHIPSVFKYQKKLNNYRSVWMINTVAISFKPEKNITIDVAAMYIFLGFIHA